MNRGAAVAHGVIAALVLALAFSAGAGVAGAQQRGIGGKDTVDVDVRVWQHVHDPLRIYVSARPEGGDWDTHGTTRLLLDDGHGRSGNYRYGDTAVADFEVRVWQHVRNPLRIYIGARTVAASGTHWGRSASFSMMATAPAATTVTATSPSPCPSIPAPRPWWSRPEARKCPAWPS